MSTKAIKKQLAAAVAMVLVAALALGSSTFAWFASNNKVTASGMSINAKAEGAMLIIGKSATELETKVTTTDLGASAVDDTDGMLYPVHPSAGISGIFGTAGVENGTTWKHATSKSFTNAILGSEEGNVALAEVANYRLATTLYIGLDDSNKEATVTNVRPSSVTITGGKTGDKVLLASARVMMVNHSDGSIIGVFAPDATTDYKGVYLTADLAEAGVDDDTNPSTPNVADAVVVGTNATKCSNAAYVSGYPLVAASLAAGQNVQVDLYIYFDGRDAACTSAQYNGANVEVSIDFMCD